MLFGRGLGQPEFDSTGDRTGHAGFVVPKSLLLGLLPCWSCVAQM